MSTRVLLNSKDASVSFGSNELRIILVGKTGAGKSATGNIILGSEYFKKDNSPNSVTTTCEEHRANVAGKLISIIDTPGLYDTNMSGENLKAEIAKCIEMSVPGPHAFLLVLRLDVRYTEEEKNVVRWIRENFGEDAMCYTVILFSHADTLNGKLLDEYIAQSNDLQSLINSCGRRCHSLNNNDTNNHSQVTELLEKIDKMVMENGGQHYTNEMYESAQRRIQEEKRKREEEKRRAEEEKKRKFKEEIERKVREEQQIKEENREKEEEGKSLENAFLGVGAGVGTAGVVAGGILLGVTTAVAGPVVIVAGGTALLTGCVLSLIRSQLKKIK